LDKTLEKWLNEQFENENTRRTYRSALLRFMKELEIEDLEEYLESAPDALKDLKTFLRKLNARPPKTISNYSNAVKLFLEEHGQAIPKNDWRQLRRRGSFPKVVRAVTRDKINTKGQLRLVLNYCHIKSKSLFLFLLSSGARIGEALHLKKEDLELDAKPVPLAHIRGEYTKGGVSRRDVPMSFEARDAIQTWLGCKDGLNKRGKWGGNYSGDLIWNYQPQTARKMWNTALKKASLDEMDSETNIHIYHVHGLRKFFRSKIGLDREQREVIMGHSGYLDEAYRRYTEADWLDLWEAYTEVVSNVSIYEIENEALRENVKDLENRLKEQEERAKAYFDEILRDKNLLDLLALRLKERLQEQP